MKAYSADIRERVFLDCDGGMTTRDAAAKYRVSTAWVRRLLQRRRETGETAPRPRRSGPVPLWEARGGDLRRAVAERPDATLEEIRAALGLSVALSTVWLALDRLGLSLKKK